jgi:hypothetical protein
MVGAVSQLEPKRMKAAETGRLGRRGRTKGAWGGGGGTGNERLVGVDPGSEGADAGVDGRLVGVAGRIAPRRRAGQTTGADERTAGIAVAGGDGSGGDADVTRDDRVAPDVLAGGVRHHRHGSLLESRGEAAAGSDVRASPARNDAAAASEVAVVSRRHGYVARVGVRRNVGETQHGDVVRVAAARRVVRMADEAGEGSQGARGAVRNGAVRRTGQHAVRRQRPTSAVGRRDGLDAADERRSARVRVAHSQRLLMGMIGDVRVASADHARIDRLAESGRDQTE